MSKLGMRKVQILSWLLQNMKLRRRVQRDQQHFDHQQELHLRVFIGRPTRLLPHAKMLLVFISFFLCWVDYALEGSTFSLSKYDFSPCFTLRGLDTHRFTEGFVSGQQDLPSDARAFSLTSWRVKLDCSLNRSFINYGELHCDSVNSSLVFF